MLNRLSFNLRRGSSSIDYFLVLVLLLGVGMRLYKLTYQSFWFDELATMYFSMESHTFSEWLDIAAMDRNPPLFYMLVHLWGLPFNYSELSVRLLPAMIGSAGLLAIYFLGKQVNGRDSGLIAVIITASSVFNLSYSQEVRAYILVFLLTTSALWFFFRAYENPSGINWAGYVVFSALNIYAHYIAIFFSLGISCAAPLVAFADHRRWPFIRRFMGATLGILILTSPLIHPLLMAAGKNSFSPTIDNPEAILSFVIFRSLDLSYYNTALFCILLGYLLVGMFNITKFSSLSPSELQRLLPAISLLLLTFLISVFVIYLKSIFSSPMIMIRYFIFCLPLLVVIISVLLATLKPLSLRYILTLLIVVSFLKTLYLDEKYYSNITKDQHREAIEYIIETSSKLGNSNHQRPLVFSEIAKFLQYYAKDRLQLLDYTHGMLNEMVPESALDSLGVWQIQYGHWNKLNDQQFERQLIDRGLVNVTNHKFKSLVVKYYSMKPILQHLPPF